MIESQADALIEECYDQRGLVKGDDRVTAICFSERDATKFSSKVGESLAGVR